MPLRKENTLIPHFHVPDSLFKPLPLSEGMKEWNSKRVRSRKKWHVGGFFGKTNAIRISVGPGDVAEQEEAGVTTERSEFGERSAEYLGAGTGVAYRLSFLVPQDFKDKDGRMVIAQWKSPHSDGSPPFAWRYRAGQLFFTVENGEHRFASEPIKLEKDIWYQLENRFILDKNHRGHCEVLVNGKPHFHYSGHLDTEKHPVDIHFKFGPYRDHEEHTDTLYYADLKRAVLNIHALDLEPEKQS